MRKRLGESLSSVQKYDAPAQNVTTPSLEALHAYTLGSRAMNLNSDWAAAIPFFQRAINIDANFASAYAAMGIAFSNLSENARAAETMRKAYELRGHASERERLSIIAYYDDVVTGNLQAARQAYEIWAQTYPRLHAQIWAFCITN